MSLIVTLQNSQRLTCHLSETKKLEAPKRLTTLLDVSKEIINSQGSKSNLNCLSILLEKIKGQIRRRWFEYRLRQWTDYLFDKEFTLNFTLATLLRRPKVYGNLSLESLEPLHDVFVKAYEWQGFVMLARHYDTKLNAIMNSHEALSSSLKSSITVNFELSCVTHRRVKNDSICS